MVSGNVFQVKRARGTKWYARWRAPGLGPHGAKQCLGPAWSGKGRCPEGYWTRRKAEAWLQEKLTDLRREGPPTETGATFNQAATEYLRYVEHEKQIDPKTLADYRGVIEGYLRKAFGDTPLEQVTPDQIDTYKAGLIAEGRLSNRTIVRHLTVLHGIFKRAKRVWGLRDNPASADLVERPRVSYSGEFDTLDGDEIELLAANAASEQDAALYKTAAFTGLRQGELLALRWEHVDFVDGLLHVRRNYTGGVEKVPKGKKVRSVPMVPEAIDTLARLKEREHFTGDRDLVFCSETGEHLDDSALRRRFKAALDRAGLRPVRFHDLRHAFASAAIQKLDAYAVQSYMGHTHYSTTQRYLHHQPRREDAAKLAEAFKAGTGAGTNEPQSNGHKSTNDAPSRHITP